MYNPKRAWFILIFAMPCLWLDEVNMWGLSVRCFGAPKLEKVAQDMSIGFHGREIHYPMFLRVWPLDQLSLVFANLTSDNLVSLPCFTKTR